MRPKDLCEIDGHILSARIENEEMLFVYFDKKVNISEFRRKYILKFRQTLENGKIETLWTEPLNDLGIYVQEKDSDQFVDIGCLPYAIKAVSDRCIIITRDISLSEGMIAYFFQLKDSTTYGVEFLL